MEVYTESDHNIVTIEKEEKSKRKRIFWYANTKVLKDRRVIEEIERIVKSKEKIE